MGPKLHDTRAWPLYEDAIFRLIQEDDDGNVNHSIEGPVTRGRGRGRGQGGKGKVATSIDPGPEPPTSTLEDRYRRRCEKQREDRHARNQEEHESHNMDVFFGGTTPLSQHVTPPPPPQPRTPANEQHANPPASIQRIVITRIVRTPASPFGRPRGTFTSIPLSPISNQPRTRRPAAGAPDIWQFFVKGSIAKGIKTICKLCYPPVEYSPSTSTGSLHVHIEACHAYEYLEACRENDWPIKIKSLALPKSNEKVTTQPDPHPPFSTGRFKAALVNWIVADDQSINVIECPEFRDLLLLL
ncbi:hypothetical protein JB92DRAFT_3111045 [Gautieria morchelliformis]|nr:hypothetical protein JB92DRAFT_3111045 [Gautieria morchelliformis]